ncbi:2-keto-4-pentenoate hydratase/2-oxohepta-3-ene-1,7-dioic acid hydratase [Neobacillus bataviensis LMG 21833]|uniref:2-keto-4-pentenoate hydratase/2-oxohepta-3-ene-1,7-dioic acid hydratase n=1 Tax=Neobacillus bataviensis LMG 21833 TaxID=1117379 RepID=K6DGE2_9BACI|nr:fumarylacetoacetate hydrolase family protein [Neobacillus bataviensis]EKN71637.1 2-keto-4-pentenoate hydratase/2-oxohepta-3-ene-1,7-dioic acid hydratase [Neobacillus bataviensis LMG 21833]
MKLISYRAQSSTHLGVVIEEDKVLSLSSLHDLYKDCISQEFTIPNDMKQFIEQNETALPYAEALIDCYLNDQEVKDLPSCFLSDVEIIAPIAQPEKIICVGLNYMDHCKETNMEPPSSPVIFSKYANAIIGDKAAIELPINSNQVDFEAELTIVIGKEAKCISEEEAEDYIFGYTIMNDVSARDLQFADTQWSRGKSADTFAPMGPVIVTKDEVGDPHQLDISLRLNDEIMQQSNTNQLIFRIPTIISFLSQSMTLKPGDVIATGTPPGVGMGRDPKVWLKDGDFLSITIENIGTLSNHVKKHHLTKYNEHSLLTSK